MAQPLWKMLVTGAAELDAGLLRLAWRRASAEKDRAALTMLAGRADLPDEVDAAARSHPWADVRGAWLGRSGQDRDVLLAAVKSERAAGALIIAAQRTNDPDVLAALATRGGKSFDTHLAASAALPTDAAAQVLLRVSAHWNAPSSITPRRCAADVVQNLRRRADIHDLFAAKVTNPMWALELAGSVTVSTKNLRRLYKLLVADPLKGDLLHLAVAGAIALATCEQLDAQLIADLKGVLSSATGQNFRTQKALAALARRRNATTRSELSRVALASASLDPDVIAALAADALRRKDVALGMQILANPAANAEAITAVAQTVSDWHLSMMGAQLMERDEDLMHAVVAVRPTIISYLREFSRMERKSLARELHERLLDGRAPDTPEAWQSVARWAEPTLDQMLDLPYAAIPHATEELRGQISVWVGEQLGHTPEAFEALDVLARDYDGTLRTLVETSRLLVAAA